VFSRFDLVIRGELKCAILYHLVCSLKGHFQIVDILHGFGEMDEKGAKSETQEIWANFGNQILMWVAPEILDPIYKMIPISDLLSYKGSLSVEPSRRSVGKRIKIKRKKATSVEKQNTSGHYSQCCVWAEV